MPKTTTKMHESKKLKKKEKMNFSDHDNFDLSDEVVPEGYDKDEDLLNMKIPLLPSLLINENKDGQRLIISHIEVENFKSFYGKQSIGEFHKNFTPIIGPNGSGKSNVIDALLFVFGYRALKIRSKKVGVLIHSSANHENINSCTVSVYFKRIIDKGCDEMQVVENSEFYISRTAYRNNSSTYKINGVPKQLKEIANFLRSLGIDLDHNRFLILQGGVEQISLMKPKAQNENEVGMLEYLEDIIGSCRLKLPINKLLFKLGQLQEQQSSQLIRLKHSEKEKLILEKPAKTITFYLKIENAITSIYNKMELCKRLVLSNEIAELTPKHESLVNDLNMAQKEFEELAQNLKKVKNMHSKSQKNLEKKQEAVTIAVANLNEKKQFIEKVTNDKKRLSDQKKKIEIEVEKEKKVVANLEGLPDKAQKKLIKLKSDLEEIEKKINYNQNEIENKLPLVKEKTESFCESHRKLEAELGKYTLIKDEIAGKLALEEEKLSNLQREKIAQRRVYADLCDSLTQIEKDYETKLNILETAKKSIPNYKKKIEDYKIEQNNLNDENAKFEGKVKFLRVELEKRRRSTEQFQSNNRLLKALMEQKKNGYIKGLYGRLGDLGAIDKKYDIAISTTCPALDNIVVDCVETAELCIKFLQKENLGIASFIALNKQQHFMSKMQTKPKTPENAPRLFDLIQVADEKVLPAFYYALNDTLVADNIVSATRISMSGQRRWRIVTLKGEVVETSGAMTGGGNAQKKGKIGQDVKVITNGNAEVNLKETDMKELRIELEKAEEKLNNIYYQLNQSQKSCRDCETELVRTKALVKNLQTEIDILEKKSMELKKTKVSQESNQDQKDEITNASAECVKKIDELKKENDKMVKVTDNLQLKLIEFIEQIDKVNDNIVGGYKTALLEAEAEKIVLEKAISKENTAIASNNRNLKKAIMRKTDLENDLKQIDLNLDNLEKANSQANDELKNLTNIVDTIRIEADEAEKVYNDLILQSKEMSANELEVEKRLISLKKDVETIQSKLKQNCAEIKLIDFEISKLKLYNLNNFPVDILNYENEDDVLHTSILNNSDLSIEDDNQNNLNESISTIFNNSQLKQSDESNIQKNLLTKQSLIGIERSKKVNSYTEEQIKNFNVKTLQKQLKILEERKAILKKENLNFGILIDYFQRVEVFDNENRSFQNISKQRDLHSDFCERLKKQRLQEFLDGLGLIRDYLKEMYRMITLGGDASLDLVDSLDPFNEGVSFTVRPPKKSWKEITNLSGGEKTLASLALVFGLHHYRPSPLYVMDEIDAALDFRNVSIISSYILQRTKNAQFIVISLRNNMFELGNRIVGIYKVFDCTSTVVFNPNEAERNLKENLQMLKNGK